MVSLGQFILNLLLNSPDARFGCVDDTIQRLAPSLKDYAGCDIIDINPGAGLWSSKIHEFLKPRRHILVEPHSNVYGQLLRPLVDVAGSRYTLADSNASDVDHWSLRDYVANGLLPEQAQSQGTNKTRRNTTLLVIANMSKKPRGRAVSEGYMARTSDSHYKALEYVRALETGSGFHSNGPVRMLMWLSDHEKTCLVPRTTCNRRRISTYFELFGHVEEVVGDVLGSHAIRREASLDLLSCILTAERMKDNQTPIAMDRLDTLPRRLRVDGIQAVSQSSEFSTSAIHGERDWHKDLNDLQKGFDNGTYSQFVGGPPGYDMKKRKISGNALSPEFERFRSLRKTETDQRRKKLALEEVLAIDVEIRAKHLAIVQNESIGTEEWHQESCELDQLLLEYGKVLDSLSDRKVKQVHFFADDRAAWSGDSSLLRWDHRTAEPIIPNADEFHHAKPLALLDFQPRTAPALELTSIQQQYFDAILLTFFTSPGLSVVNALDSMAPGAAHALLPNAPSLQDPRLMGRRDLDRLRVRSLTPLMLQELAIALDRWPFKPTLGELSRTVPWVDH